MRLGGTQRASSWAGPALLAAALAAGGCSNAPVRAAAAPPTPATPENAAVVGVVTREGATTELGSGFFVGPDRVVTCLHCVDGHADARIRLADRREIRVLGVLAEDRVHDLVLVAVETTSGSPAPLPVSDEPVATGTTLTAVGSYRGRGGSAARVRVTGGEEPRKRIGTAYRAQGEIGPGSSGGPLLDDQGRVRGVVVERDTSAASTGLVVPSRFVRALVAGPLEPMARFGARTAGNPELALRRSYEAALQRFYARDYEGARRGAEHVYAEGRSTGSLYRWAALDVLVDALRRTGRAREALDRLTQIAAENPGHAEPAQRLAALQRELAGLPAAPTTVCESAPRETVRPDEIPAASGAPMPPPPGTLPPPTIRPLR